MKDKSKVIVEFCDCQGNHKTGCPLYLRLLIKEKICKKHNIISYVPSEVENEIDEEVEKKLPRWLKLKDLEKEIVNNP